jgi:hypothetical protein
MIMRNRSLWILAAAAALFAATMPALQPWPARLAFPGPEGTAYAQETMTFEPVPEESVAASEKRRAQRLARDAEQRAAESAKRRDAGKPAPLDAPDTPDAPDAPDVPPAPEFSRAGDIVRIGSDIEIPKGQVVEGDVFALRGDIRVDGHVKGNVAATGGDVTLGSTARVDGDVMCIGGKLIEEDGARVTGQRVTALRGNARRDRIERMARRVGDDWELRRDYGDLGFALSWLVVWLLLAWGIAKFAPGRTGVTLDAMRDKPGLSLMVGLGLILLLVPSVVALALVVAVLCITIIGIPLALGVIVAYAGLLVVLLLWGGVVGVTPIGQRLGQQLNRPGTLVSAAVLGVLVVSGLRVISEVVQFLPLFGWFGKLLWVVAFLVGTVATLMGAGALLRTKFGQGPDGRWWPLFTTAKPPAPGMTPPASDPGSASPPPPPPPPAPSGGPSEPSPVT